MKRSFQYHLSREIRAIRMLHGVTPQFFPIVTLNAIVKAVLPYATVFLSARILTELATLRRPNVLWKWVIVSILATALLSVLRSFFMEREESTTFMGGRSCFSAKKPCPWTLPMRTDRR